MKNKEVKMATNEQLLDEYIRFAIKHRTASRQGDHKSANRSYKNLDAIMDELRNRGPTVCEMFLRLLGDERIEVRSWVAAHALEFAPKRAVPVLEAIVAGPSSLEEMSARILLDQWQSSGRDK